MKVYAMNTLLPLNIRIVLILLVIVLYNLFGDKITE